MKKRVVDRRPIKVKFEKPGNKKRVLNYFIIFIFVAAIAATAAYMIYFQAAPCTTYECFESAMVQCKRAIYINEDPGATWRYRINGLKDEQCLINVKLLGAKKGEFKLETLIGYEMTCSYPRGAITYPEKDLRNCHGRLKEEFQSITIERLHKVILENLEDIGEELGPVTGF